MAERNLLSLVQSELETIGYLVQGLISSETTFIPADPNRVYLFINTPVTAEATLIAKLDRGQTNCVIALHKLVAPYIFTIDDALKLVTEQINVSSSGADLYAIGVRYKG